MKQLIIQHKLKRNKQETSTNNVIELLFNEENGLGFGNGAISRLQQLVSGELSEDCEQRGLDYIRNHPDAFVLVDKSDDGCSDGRIAAFARQLLSDGTIQYAETLLNRAKVFGGGVMMVAAGKIGTGDIAASPSAQFDDGIRFLSHNSMRFGAHDDENAIGENCGCGAIDKYPEHLENSQRFKAQIKNSFMTLFGDEFNEEIFENVSENFRKALAAAETEPNYSGRRVWNSIAKAGAVIKRLTGQHQEDFIVINFVHGTTLNQSGLAKATDNQVQAFCVDAWRLQEYARNIGGGDSAEEHKAMYGMLMYTLATSGTLTDGSQRVLIRK